MKQSLPVWDAPAHEAIVTPAGDAEPSTGSSGTQTTARKPSSPNVDKTTSTPKTADPSQLVGQAWQMIQEALQAGTITLGNGNSKLLETKEIVRLVTWLANQRQKKPKVVAMPEDFNLKQTES